QWSLTALPESLVSLMLVVVAFYFGARTMTPDSDTTEKNPDEKGGFVNWLTSLKDSPLFLPKGTIRFLMIVAFGTLAYFTYSKNGSIPEALLQILTIIAGYILGIIITYFYHKISDKTDAKVSVFGHVKAAITLLFIIFINTGYIFDWSFATSGVVDRLMTLLITFYFGSRTLARA
ncbi:MAG: hypothetical protein QW728_02065, partial [Thermoplasmata archaeon]